MAKQPDRNSDSWIKPPVFDVPPLRVLLNLKSYNTSECSFEGTAHRIRDDGGLEQGSSFKVRDFELGLAGWVEDYSIKTPHAPLDESWSLIVSGQGLSTRHLPEHAWVLLSRVQHAGAYSIDILYTDEQVSDWFVSDESLPALSDLVGSRLYEFVSNDDANVVLRLWSVASLER